MWKKIAIKVLKWIIQTLTLGLAQYFEEKKKNEKNI